MAVYLIRDTGSDLVKIGFSAKPWSRLSKIQTDSSTALVVVAVIEGDVVAERALHERFVADRVRGEWFRRSEELCAFIEGLPTPARPKAQPKTAAFWNGKSTAQVVAETGISQPMLSRIRKGARRPSPEVAIRIQRATGLSAIKLVFGDLAEEAA